MKSLKAKSSKLIAARDGFTMSELIIAMSLFIVVMAITSGVFVQSIRSERNIVASTSANSNITQTLERIAREIRTGYNFDVPIEAQLEFRNSDNQQVSYKKEATSIERCVGLSNCALITSDKLVINTLKFIHVSSTPPRITIVIQAAGVNNAVINFQTTVAARIIGS